ncbi:MAG TPA: ABC transporter permease [Candidatus Saccharimonadales bacterium]|nr:ABC transporter permease [Candidatus Saccharimonadales bacterium]
MTRSNNNVRMAMAAIGAARWRSFLTMLGVIIGVASVVTIVSLGEGVKHQLTSQIEHTGKDLITVRGGRVADYDKSGKVSRVNILNLFAGTSLNDADYQTVLKAPGVQVAAPFAVLSGVPRTPDGVADPGASIVATNEKGAVALNQPIAYGSFFEARDNAEPAAVIGKRVAEDLFRENVPIGKTFILRGETFTVHGVFEQFAANPLTPGVDYNSTIFIPYDYAKQLPGSPIQPYQILVRPKAGVSSAALAGKLTDTLADAHGSQMDFSVLKANDSLAVASNVLNVLTAMVSAVAAVSLLVGGIGIMNIMLVAVSERTFEIGVRKSIGATNRQILGQFLIEALVISGVGGILGVLVSLLMNYLLRIFTNLQPVVTLPVMGVAVVAALAVGTIFGMTPALKAAHKDPIEALRRV